jgi:hypothetical protein
MESSPQPTLESIKTEDQLVQIMADLNVTDKSD